MLKKVSLIAVLLLFVFVFTVSISAQGEFDVYVYDDADFLDVAEEAELNTRLYELSAETGAQVLVYLTDDSYYEGVWFCSDHGYDTSDDIILLIITEDYGTYYYDLYTYGEAYYEISNSEVDRILDHKDVYENIKAGSFLAGITGYAEASSKAYSGILWAPVKSTLTVGIVVFVLVMLITSVSIISSYKKKLKATIYPLERYTTLDLKDSSDVFLGSSVTKVRINTSSGGGRSGGSRSGGGSGHRGGR